MTETKEQIKLSGSDIFFPQNDADAYHVDEGDLFVFIVEWKNGKPQRRVFLCEAVQGRMVPSFFVEKDMNYRSWRFAFVAKGEGVTLSLRNQGATEILRRKFLRRAGLTTYEQEGFNGSLIDYYKREEVKDRAYIWKGDADAPAAKAEAFAAIKAVFHDHSSMSLSGNANYQALDFVCTRMGASLMAQEDLVARCGKEPEVTEIANASHLICRKVVLEAGWFKNDCGALVGTMDREVVGCVPGKNGVYQLFRTSDGSTQPLTAELAQQISPQAWSIGRTLPIKKLTRKDIFQFCKGSITARDLVPAVVLALACALIGVLLPTLNKMIYDDYIPLGNVGNLTEICLVMLTFMIGNVSFSIVKNLFDFRITSRVGNDLQNAAYHRLFHLPESFFRSYDSADLGGRVAQIGPTASGVANAIVVTGVSALFSIVYLIRMITYSGKLSWISVGMYLVYTILIVCITSMARKGEADIAKADAEASSRLYQYLNGVDKIRMAGVEERALLSYMKPYARQQSGEIRVNRLASAREALAGVISSIFSMVLYLIIVKKSINLSIGAFVAFNTAFGSFTGALNSLVDELLKLYQEKETITRFWPIFETVPEDDDTKEVPGEMSGGIALEHVSFAYEQGGKNVLNDLSINIKPGEYVGVVGSSGCGKSTLLKLLLGFESPQSGIVMVDGKDLRSIDKGAYRRQLGVVLQNGKLISGSIYENITITAPHVKMARVNEVINQVGLREDINQMPMGIHTVLSENCNTISGGQQQRILIARAIVGTPKILIFDEATSALDNITQAAVSSNLDKMNVTRIVVAHRLSTIKNCDRILVLKDGGIAEEGNYESLMAQKGLFYQLATRQIAQ